MEDPVIISFGGGKGGTGKTTLAAVTGSLLAGKGFRTLLVDADLGGANLHMHLGIKRPERGLSDYLSGRCGSLSEVILETPVNNLGLISGASDILQVANPKYAQKEKILRNIKGLDTDYILLDLGAGSSIHVSDFFAYFPYGVVVSDTTPESVENAYGFMKNSIIRGMLRLFRGREGMKREVMRFADISSSKSFATLAELLEFFSREYPDEHRSIMSWLSDKGYFLVLNRIISKKEVEVGRRFVDIVKKYLGIRMEYIGYIPDKKVIREASKRIEPLVKFSSEEGVTDPFESITENLINLTKKR